MSRHGAEPGTVVTIRVPATSANLGPGFDCLAISLQMYNTIEVEVLAAAAEGRVDIDGEGASSLGGADENLVLVAMQRIALRHDAVLPHMHIRMHNGVPLGRGLGSSAAAIAGGLLAAALILGVDHDPRSLLQAGLDLEGHPDNIVAALWGGFTVGVVHEGEAFVQRLTVPSQLQAVLLIPEQSSSTAESRGTLPPMVSRADAVFNAGRVGLIVAAMTQNRPDLLRVAMDDRLHQPSRGRAFTYLQPAIEAACVAGAVGAALSGAGSSVIALATDHFEAVARALAQVAAQHAVPARTCIVPVDQEGATHRLRVPDR